MFFSSYKGHYKSFPSFSRNKDKYQIAWSISSSPKTHHFSEATPLLYSRPPCPQWVSSLFPSCLLPGAPLLHALLRTEDPRQRLKMPEVRSKLQEVCRLHYMTWICIQHARREVDWLETNSIPTFLKMTQKEGWPQRKKEKGRAWASTLEQFCRPKAKMHTGPQLPLDPDYLGLPTPTHFHYPTR